MALAYTTTCSLFIRQESFSSKTEVNETLDNASFSHSTLPSHTISQANQLCRNKLNAIYPLAEREKQTTATRKNDLLVLFVLPSVHVAIKQLSRSQYLGYNKFSRSNWARALFLSLSEDEQYPPLTCQTEATLSGVLQVKLLSSSRVREKRATKERKLHLSGQYESLYLPMHST